MSRLIIRLVRSWFKRTPARPPKPERKSKNQETVVVWLDDKKRWVEVCSTCGGNCGQCGWSGGDGISPNMDHMIRALGTIAEGRAKMWSEGKWKIE